MPPVCRPLVFVWLQFLMSGFRLLDFFFHWLTLPIRCETQRTDWFGPTEQNSTTLASRAAISHHASLACCFCHSLLNSCLSSATPSTFDAPKSQSDYLSCGGLSTINSTQTIYWLIDDSRLQLILKEMFQHACHNVKSECFWSRK